jgi:hypothetical protein
MSLKRIQSSHARAGLNFSTYFGVLVPLWLFFPVYPGWVLNSGSAALN